MAIGLMLTGTVVRQEQGTDWAGRAMVRLDVSTADVPGIASDVHIYVLADHPLAVLAVGRTIEFEAE